MAYTSFADLRKNRGNFDTLRQEAEKMAAKGGYEADNRFWQPTVDKAGNGFAVIRFLPPPRGETLAWARYWNHGFKGPSGRWYIENSLTTLGLNDPVSELNSQLWNSGVESNKDIARQQKRRLNYVSNILVVRDPGNPDNEGKVFLFKYGKKIFDKIKYKMQPEFEDEQPMNPFDFWEGANFKMKIRKVEGYRNYDKSEFDAPSPVSTDDDEIEKIWNQEHSLLEFTDKKNFKTYEELKTKLDEVLRGAKYTGMSAEEMAEEKSEDAPPMKSAKPSKAASFEEDDDDEDAISYFEKLNRA